MRPNIRKGKDENLTDAAIADVITKLNSDTPITKKLACELLSISYNTTRLAKIIDEYIDRRDFAIKRKKELRNTPVSIQDEKYIVSSYLESMPIQELADSVFRSVGIVKRVLTKYNVPLRSPGVTYCSPIDLMQESEAPQDYVIGDLVYSARYDCPAEIKKCIKDDRYGGMVYGLWLYKYNKNAYQPYYELSDLRKVQKELNIVIQDITPEEIRHLINEGLKNAKKRDKDK